MEAPIIAERIGDAEVIVTNKTPISKETMDKCPNLKMIAVLATGYNVINYDYAKEKGIPVCNVPTYGTACVGQYAIALLLEVCHHIGHHDKTVHEGKWANHIDWCYWDHPLIELDGKTAGIIGFGRIGQTTGRIAKALGMKVLAYDPYVKELPEEFQSYVTLCGENEVISGCDFLSLHLPLNDETRNMISAPQLASMKAGAYVINAARGGIVNEKDLYEALVSGHIAGAAMDVSEVEPMAKENPLRTLDNVIIYPHIGGNTTEAAHRASYFAAMGIQEVYEGKAPTWPINDVDYKTAKTYTDTKKPDTKPAGMFDF